MKLTITEHFALAQMASLATPTTRGSAARRSFALSMPTVPEMASVQITGVSPPLKPDVPGTRIVSLAKSAWMAIVRTLVEAGALVESTPSAMFNDIANVALVHQDSLAIQRWSVSGCPTPACPPTLVQLEWSAQMASACLAVAMTTIVPPTRGAPPGNVC